ncbi:hypothetical protein BOX15_Mlig013028g3 [Macrostomum lignano]|uniref:C-type lectin domain-containing protein n=1 Tax=Macrostomum lignano TaxID=282301 RepID=A0A267G519_9PLAT|nr:hypothetical protein BOX15_Mlig013028g3 [Macrostomum lignano]
MGIRLRTTSVFAALLLAACIAGTGAQNNGKCPAGWVGRENSNWCYEFASSNGNYKSWDDAKLACEVQHGTLLAMADVSEREWVARRVNGFQSGSSWWLGLERTTGVWRWVDNRSGGETPGNSPEDGRVLTWYEGHSDSSPGNCMSIRVDGTKSEILYVYPRSCNKMAAYICKKQKQDATTCDADDGWETHGDRCYKAFNSDNNGAYWEDARDHCNRIESDLVIVNDATTSQIVRDIVNRGGPGAITNTFWIGLRSVQTGSNPDQYSWRWVDNSPAIYKAWTNGEEPQAQKGLCVHTEGTDSSQLWRAYGCNGRRFGFVCSRPTGTCATGWYQHRDTCYSLNPTQLSWTQASDHCQSYGATLLRIKQDHVQKFINMYREDFARNGIEYIWMGMYRAVSESGEIKWTSGDPVSSGYTNWANGQPQLDDGRANAGRVIAIDDGGRWQIANPTAKGGFVCEIPLGKTPLVPTTVYPSFVCEQGWILYGSRCYKLESNKFVDWLTARANCQAFPGADLIDIRGRSEQEFIQKQLDPRRDYWIGLHTRSTEDRSWVWVVDNSPMDYQNWQKGEPNNLEKEENCVEMYTSGTWNDNRCTYRLSYICKVLANVNGSPRPTLPGTTTPNFDPFCGPLWRRDPTSNYCYLFNTDPLIWFDAKHQCEFQGGKLASIVTQEEKAYIAARIKTMKDEDSGILGFWLGFNDRAEEGYWVWDDGEPVTYLNWVAGEPNNAGAGEDCGMIYADSAMWNDVACEKRYASICKKLGNVLITIEPPPATTIEVPDGYLRGCRDGYSVHNNMCYKVFTSRDDEMTWYDAKARCQLEGGDLASVMNLAEQQFLQELAVPRDFSYWIGLYDSLAIDRMMYFKWSDTSKPTFTYWFKNEPNNYLKKDDCVEIVNMWGGWNGRWNDQNCDKKRRFACKQRQKPVLVLPPVTKPPGCPEGYDDAYGGQCLKFVTGTTLMTATAAKAACQADGGFLASIPTEDVQNHIFLRLTELRQTSNYWIGLVRSGLSFRWEDGRQFSYSNWMPNSILYGLQGQISPILGFWQMSYSTIQGNRNYICQVNQIGYSTPTKPPTTYNPEYCAYSWVEANGNCYKGFSATDAENKLTWSEARAHCKSLSGDLASIHNNETMTKLEETVGGSIGYWIGLNTRDENKGFVWADGSPANYFKWRGDKQPENINNNQNCGVLSPSDMSWVIDNCNAAMNWICETPKGIYPTGTTVEPTTPPDAPDCGDGWKYYNGSCYLMSTTLLEWHNALKYCRDVNADLASIHGNEETDFLLRLSSKLHISIASYWIGLNELGQTSGWSWTDGTGVNYFNWNVGEPNNAGGAEHCGAFYSSNGLWNDDQCGERHRFICKRNNDTSRTVAPTTPMPGYCPKWYFRVGNKCFRIYEDQLLTWADARAVCANTGSENVRGYLASISNEYEQAALTSYKSYNDSNLWIGLFARYNIHLYYWLDNTPFTYSNWAYNEPNSVNEMCVHMYTERFRAGQWNDADCNRKMGFVCMTYKDKSLVTEWQPPTSTVCEANWKPFGSSCYRYLPTANSWSDAQRSCASLGANLASIHDVYEQNFAHYLTESIAQVPTWIGLSDVNSMRGNYQWSDRWHLTYVNWGSGQPGNNEQATCVQIDKTGAWFAVNCTTRLPALCRKSNGPMPTTQPHLPGTCPPEFVPQFDSCYFAANSTVRVSASTAQIECQRLYRSNLVSILTQSEQNFVAGLINSKVQQSGTRRDYWIGLLRSSTGGFEWNDLSPLGYVYWSLNEPSNTPNENCVEMYESNKKWNDHYCSKLNSYVCKMPKLPSTDSGITTTTTATTRTTQTTVSGQTRPTQQLTTTRPVTTQSPGVRAIADLKNDALVIGAVVLFLALLIGAVLAVFFYRRQVGPKSVGGGGGGGEESGFANANWSSATNEVSLETGRSGDTESKDGFSNPSFAGDN